jgi:protein-S-isoprenylcysteine O-methyltransferase Ste14
MPASSRLPELGKRGQGWVAVQSILILSLVPATLSEIDWPGSVGSTLTVLGLVLVASGLLLLIAAGASLAFARAASMLPSPRTGSRVAQRGAYRVVRHPIYGAVLLLAVGASLATSPLALAPTILLAAVFDLKARVEEAWLRERDAAYDAYRARTPRRFVPGVY